MIGDGNRNLFASLQDATPVVEQEPQFGTTQTTEPGVSSSFLSAFMGTNAETEGTDQTANFAQALGSTTTETADLAQFGATENFAQALGQEGQEVPTNTTSLPESTPVFNLAELSSAKDAEDLYQLQLELKALTAELQAQVLQAQAQNSYAVQEEAKFLLADEANMGGIYYISFVQRLIESVKRAIKSMTTIATSSANHGASWKQTMDHHSRQRDELKLHAQAAG